MVTKKRPAQRPLRTKRPNPTGVRRWKALALAEALALLGVLAFETKSCWAPSRDNLKGEENGPPRAAAPTPQPQCPTATPHASPAPPVGASPKRAKPLEPLPKALPEDRSPWELQDADRAFLKAFRAHVLPKSQTLAQCLGSGLGGYSLRWAVRLATDGTPSDSRFEWVLKPNRPEPAAITRDEALCLDGILTGPFPAPREARTVEMLFELP